MICQTFRQQEHVKHCSCICTFSD